VGKPSLQDFYLNQLRKGAVHVTTYLMNGVPLKGRVVGFDNFVVVFEAEGKQSLVFKHAISTIQPARPIDLQPLGEGEGS